MLNTIFTFWEPADRMPAYLRLCMDTWKVNLSGMTLIVLDHSNLHKFIPDGSLSLQNLKRFPLLVQKDGIMSAVLKFTGGMFIDADMILAGKISGLLSYLEKYEMVTFGHHLSFAAARPDTLLLNEWYAEVRDRINQFAGDGKTVNWDYLGNSIVNRKLKKPRKYRVKVIDEYDAAFTPEILYFINRMNAIKQYGDFWFSESIGTDKVFYKNQAIIMLHNSWTPGWYSEFTRDEVLDHSCLLSRSLRHLLSPDQKTLAINHVSFSVYLMAQLWRLFKAIRRRLEKVADIKFF